MRKYITGLSIFFSLTAATTNAHADCIYFNGDNELISASSNTDKNHILPLKIPLTIGSQKQDGFDVGTVMQYQCEVTPNKDGALIVDKNSPYKHFEHAKGIHTLVRDIPLSMSFISQKADLTADVTCENINIKFDSKKYGVPEGDWSNRDILARNFMEATLGILHAIDEQSRVGDYTGRYKINEDNTAVSFIPDENSPICPSRALMY